jgi:hypothetical protein
MKVLPQVCAMQQIVSRCMFDSIVVIGKQKIPDSYILRECIQAGYVDVVRMMIKVY